MSTDVSFIQYDEHGVIVEWGPPNATTLVDVCVEGQTNQVLRVDAWKVLYVKVWIRNIYRPTQFACVSRWEHMCSFVVERWDQVFPHFELFYGSAGIANRFKWDVERWLWTSQNGWEPDDYPTPHGGDATGTSSTSTLGWFS